MEFTWRCNVAGCRKDLRHQAVVTTCSHIFCLDCAANTGLATLAQGVRTCPACDTDLINRDDAVITQLDPTEDYKTSVLSGFSPALIMECATRALSFYNYQALHETTYQEFLATRLTQKVDGLNEQLDNIVKDANDHMSKLQRALKESEARCADMESRTQEVQNAFRQKAKALSDVTKKYEALKGEKMAAQTMNAASDEAEQMYQTMSQRLSVQANAGLPHGFRRPRSRNGSSEEIEGLRVLHSSQRAPQSVRRRSREYTTQSNPLFLTPSAQRTVYHPLGTGSRIPRMATADGGDGTYRQPLGNIQPNSMSRPSHSAYGMGVGAKLDKRPLRSATPRINRHTGPSDLPMR